MALQVSGAISILDIATEFGGSAPHSLSEYYRGGGLVPDTPTNSGVPTSGAISLANFYGAAAFVPDVTPNAVNWANITGIGSGQNSNQTITGINTTITLSFNNSTSPSAIVSVYVNNSFVDSNVNGQTTNFTVNNNDVVYFSAAGNFGEAPSGTVTVRNVSDGNVVLDTFTINITADGGL